MFLNRFFKKPAGLITDAEPTSQGILRNDGDIPVIQHHGVDLKEHFDKIDELREEIHKRDMQIIEEKFNRGAKSGGWEAFSRLPESSAGKELGKEALETISISYPDYPFCTCTHPAAPHDPVPIHPHKSVQQPPEADEAAGGWTGDVGRPW